MPDTISPLISTAYSADVFQRAAEQWQQLLSTHMRKILQGDGPVLNWNSPESSIALAESWLRNSPADVPAAASRDDLAERLNGILSQMLRSGQNLHHPHYIGHQVPASVPLAGLFDAVSSVTNQVMAVYEMGPWATAVEHALVRALCRKVGWDAEASTGLLTHGGSLANLTALLTARNVRLPGSWEDGVPSNAILVTHPDAHYCVTRSAGILGLGSRQVVKVAIDPQRRMDPDNLDRVLTRLSGEGRQIMAVSACACGTPTGAFDPLEAIATVCERHQVWLHVDAAHGGGLMMSRKHRTKLAGIDRADSVVWDAHKMLFVPALCAAVLYRNREHRFETFQQNAPYLFDPSVPGMADIDSGMRTVECTKRAMGFGLWGLWSLFGEQIFEQMVDRVIEVARQLHELLNEQLDFQTLHTPECNILAFRYVPPSLANAADLVIDTFQRDVRTRLIQSGHFYIVQTTLDNRAALRVAVMNPMTTTDDLQELLSAIRDTGQQLNRQDNVAGDL
ncbi:MAG TPA: aminotransferase class I/II-fold pyridoxal phosphate-dependent enzyme [Planctomycetaceae bacterium]|nr:aminotransferase class I/II-fold pyridoxal phosphate-dependent enzyme [Planctomycetaceae bacterium]